VSGFNSHIDSNDKSVMDANRIILCRECHGKLQGVEWYALLRLLCVGAAQQFVNKCKIGLDKTVERI
jgi:hypothetical protein